MNKHTDLEVGRILGLLNGRRGHHVPEQRRLTASDIEKADECDFMLRDGDLGSLEMVKELGVGIDEMQ